MIVIALLILCPWKRRRTAVDLIRRNTKGYIIAVTCECSATVFSDLETTYIQDEAASAQLVEALGNLELKYEKRDPNTTVTLGIKTFHISLKTENEHVDLTFTTDSKLFFDDVKYSVLSKATLTQLLEKESSS